MRKTIGVLDDNRVFLQEFVVQLQTQCKAMGIEAQIQAFEKSQAFYDYLRASQGVDIAFVDIILPGQSGIDFARTIQQEFPAMKLVFITGVIENAADIFEARPTYFLVKPVTPERLGKALETVLEELESEAEKTVVLEGKGRTFRIKQSEITYVESLGRKIEVHLTDSVLSIYSSMKEMEALFGDELFRCHRSYMVNLAHAREINNLGFVLYSGHTVPVARAHRTQARTRFFAQLSVDEAVYRI